MIIGEVANLLERSTARHTLNDPASKRLKNTKSPRPYGTWRHNKIPSFRTGIVNSSEQISEHGSGRNSLTSPTWISKRRNVEAVPSPVEGYRIETEPQKEVVVEAFPEEVFPEEQQKMDDDLHSDKVDGEVEVKGATSIEIVKQTSVSSVDNYPTLPIAGTLNHPLAVPALEDIEDVPPEEPTSEALSSMDAPLGHISSSSTLVKSAEMPTNATVDHLDAHTSQPGSSVSSSNDNDNLSQLQLPEDSISLMTAEDSQHSHYGSVDEDKSINTTGLPEEITKVKVGNKEILVEQNAVHENGWVSMDNESEELSNKVDLDTLQSEKKQEFSDRVIGEKISTQFYTNCSINHDNSDILLPDGRSPTNVTSLNITSPKPLGALLDYNDDRAKHELSIPVDSGNGEDAGVSPTLSSVSCSDGRSSCHSSNLYTPQTASSEAQDNEVSEQHTIRIAF